MTDIRTLTYEELEQFIFSINEKKFRAKQVWTWLWKKGAGGYDEMTDLSLALRAQLAEHFTFQRAVIDQEVHSRDKSAKFAFRLHDDRMVEGVLIPSGDRVTACVSSQVGCPLRCTFCATGTMGFVRNLCPGVVRQHHHQHRVYGDGRAAAQLRQRDDGHRQAYSS